MIIWAAGDGATGGTDSATVAAMIANSHADAFLWLGDVYESGTAGDFANNYKPSWGALDKICWPVPGNHDWPNYATGYMPYFREAARPYASYHAFTLQGWRLIMLNSEEPMDPDSAQLKWAANQVGPNGKNIACWHRPRYCSGSHGDATDTDGLWQLLGPHCPVILGGHAHNMQHFKPDATGCRQLVSGAAGRSLYAEIEDDPRLAWGNAQGYGAVRLDCQPSSVKVEWVDEQGKSLYEETIAVA